MPRKKKIVKKKTKEIFPDVTNNSAGIPNDALVFNPGIGIVEVDFGRDDLNGLRDKINEIIRKINS